MYMQPRNIASGKLKDEFNQPVESIMRCDDFKSNFARKLSNRFTSRSSVSQMKQDTELNLRPPNNSSSNSNNSSNSAHSNITDNVSKINEQKTQPPRKEQNGEAVKPPDKPISLNSDIRRTEVTVLNMEVETLRWQLEQTEANRQMHIALLKQIVAFLNRVKEHIEQQNNCPVFSQDTLPKRLLQKSFNIADLPRSRSVVQVNRNFEYPLTTPKKICTRKISKSISNVNGYKEYNNMWNQPKVFFDPATETSQKISEEMSRLIILAKTVLTTKIPDLACSCNDTESYLTKQKPNVTDDGPLINSNAFPLCQIEENVTSIFKECLDNSEDGKGTGHNKNVSSSTLCEHELNIDFHDIKSNKREPNNVMLDDRTVVIAKANTKISEEKRNEFNCSFLEDESGFSSMSSFQEIGIPIISIIPPSPCEEIGFSEKIPDLIQDDNMEKWKTDTIELEKQTMKVFWV